MNIEIVRDSYTDTTTLGKMYINGEYFCETLEDIVRPHGIKVNGSTAIPENIKFKVSVTMSNRFKRLMTILYTEDDLQTIKGNGKKFVGVRCHGGNTHKNTEGCPLVAKNRLNSDTIQGTMEKELTAKVQQAIQNYEDVTLICINSPQEG